jgi:hypothetical protein
MVSVFFLRKKRPSHGFLIAMSARKPGGQPISPRACPTFTPSAGVHPLGRRAKLTITKKQREGIDDDFHLESPPR